jgi:hypothetical protein
MDGFCYYLNRGDFTFGHPTDLLWDGCKCCGINEQEELELLDTSINTRKETFNATTDDSKYF